MEKLCECGCGQPTARSRANQRGYAKGEPLRFIHGHNHTIRVITESDYRIEDRGFISPCWTWIHCTSIGYGKVTINKKKTWAHIAMWIQTNGPVPDGLELDHLCRNPSCIRPDHLDPVTHAENLRRGATAKLTPEKRSQIDQLRLSGLTYKRIAEIVGVGKSTVGAYLSGHTWSH